MADEKFDDRALSEASDAALPKPQIQIIVDGKKIFKPGMKTYFVESDTESSGAGAGAGAGTGTGTGTGVDAKVGGTYCSCDTVVSTHLICTCESVSTCSCVGHTVVSPCACVMNTSGGTVCTCQAVSCGSPCACVPVYI